MTAEFTVTEAAALTGYTRARLYQMVKKQQIAFRRVPVRTDVRIPRATVEELRVKKAAAAAREYIAGKREAAAG